MVHLIHRAGSAPPGTRVRLTGLRTRHMAALDGAIGVVTANASDGLVPVRAAELLVVPGHIHSNKGNNKGISQ